MQSAESQSSKSVDLQDGALSFTCLAALLENSHSTRVIAPRSMQEPPSQMRQKVMQELQGKVVEILDEEPAGHSKGSVESCKFS